MAEKTTVVRYFVLGWIWLIAMTAHVHRVCLAVPVQRIERPGVKKKARSRSGELQNVLVQQSLLKCQPDAKLAFFQR
jgi:hypothetical protein